MADKWSVEPSEGVIKINDGIFQFPENSGTTDIEYVVTYYSDTCNCTCTKTVVVEPGGCECSITSKTESIQADAGNYNVGKVNIVGACEITWEKIENPDDFVSNISIDNGIIYADIAENVGDARQAKFKTDCGDDELIINQAESGACVIDWNSYSDSKCNTCDCGADDFELLETSIDVPGNGLTNYAIATVNTCVGHIAFVESKNWGCTIPDGSTLKLTVPTNSGGNRSETITFTYQDRCNNEIGEKTLSLVQEAACPASGGTSNPNDGVVVILSSMPLNGCDDTYGGYFAFKFEDPAFSSLAYITVDGTVVVGVTVYDFSMPLCKGLAVSTARNNTGAQRTGKMTVVMNVVGGGQCSYEIPVTQKAYNYNDCDTPEPYCTVNYKNETGTQIEDGYGYVYDSNGVEIGMFTIHELPAGQSLSVSLGRYSLNKTVVSARAWIHLRNQGFDLICKKVTGDIIDSKLVSGASYEFNITSETC
jgi:hypothetical protein